MHSKRDVLDLIFCSGINPALLKSACFCSVQFYSRWAERSCFSCSSNITATYLYQGMLSFVASWAEEPMCGYIAGSVRVRKPAFTMFCKELKDFHHLQISWQPDCVLFWLLWEFSDILKIVSHSRSIARVDTSPLIHNCLYPSFDFSEICSCFCHCFDRGKWGLWELFA